MLKVFLLNGEPRNDIINLNENCDFDFLNLDLPLILGPDEGVYAMLEALVLNVLSSSVLLDCPSSASSTVLGELFTDFVTEMKSSKAGELVLSLIFSFLNLLEFG